MAFQNDQLGSAPGEPTRQEVTRTARILKRFLEVAAGAWLLVSVLFVAAQVFRISVVGTLASITLAVAVVLFVAALAVLGRYLFGGPQPA